VEVDGEATQAVSGWLEVEVVAPANKAVLLHSKKNGDGYVDSDTKLQKIMQGIAKCLG
jgi:hypothetical protein